MSTFRLDKLLTPHLRVLDLSYASINSLPPSFSHLQNLYLLSLRGCSQLETLSPLYIQLSMCK
jgi:Leucine-rich repeat (LRR) protein